MGTSHLKDIFAVDLIYFLSNLMQIDKIIVTPPFLVLQPFFPLLIFCNLMAINVPKYEAQDRKYLDTIKYYKVNCWQWSAS